MSVKLPTDGVTKELMDSGTSCTLSEMATLIEHQPEGTILYFQGQPGIGKTQTMYEVAARTNSILWNRMVSTREPTDFAGVPFRNPNGKHYFDALPMQFIWACSDQADPEFSGPTKLFLDDAHTAGPQLQAALLQLESGIIGDLNIRSNVRIVMAGNRIEDNAGAFEMITPLANRLVRIGIKVSVSEWLDWAITKINPLITGFIRQHNHHLNTWAPEITDANFVTPRSYEKLSRLMAAYKDHIPFMKYAPGVLGLGISLEFQAYLANAEGAVPPEDIIKDPEHAKVPSSIRELDALHATISSLITYLHENPTCWKQASIYCTRPEMMKELGVVLTFQIFNVLRSKLSAKEKNTAVYDKSITNLIETYSADMPEDLMR